MIGAPPKSAVAAQRAALEAARRRTALQVDTLAHAVVDMDDAVGWARLTELGTRSTVVAQESAVSATADLLNATLNAADLVGDIASLPGIQPGRLASGNDVRGMFAATRDIVARRMTAPDVTFPMALDASASKLVAIASSEPHRIGRDGQLAVGLSDERFNRYRRVAVGNTCTFCLMLATRGAVYLTAASAGQSRKYHANCVPADTLVTSPGTEAATRRWYEGELVVVATAGGKQLRITPNHPVLTDHGWVNAGSLKVGDYVVDGSRLDGQRLGVPDVDDAPSLIGDVFEAIRMRGDAVRVESSPEDFYGDGRDGYVDVVRPYGLLDHDFVSALPERIADQGLALGRWLGRVPLPRQGGCGEAFGAELGASHGGMSGSRAPRSVLGGHGRCAYHRRFRSSPDLDAAITQFGQQRAAGHSVATGNGQSGFAGHVLLDGHVGHIQSARTAAGRAATRFDPMSAHQDGDHVRAYAQKGADLLVRVAGQIALDPVVDVRRTQWSGHVFDLQTVEGWFVADGLMVSNCDCYVELVVDQDAIARSKALQGDWRNAIRDQQRLMDAGAMSPALAGQVSAFQRPVVTAIAPGAPRAALRVDGVVHELTDAEIVAREGSFAARITKQRFRVYADGDVTVKVRKAADGSGAAILTDEQVQTFMGEWRAVTAQVWADMPEGYPRPIAVIDDTDMTWTREPGCLAYVNDARFAPQNHGGVVRVNPRAARGDFVSDGGHFAPVLGSARDAGPADRIRYVLMHELGHLHGWAWDDAYALAQAPEAAAAGARISEYAAESWLESYAEAFAEWMLARRPSVAARRYARLVGWEAPR